MAPELCGPVSKTVVPSRRRDNTAPSRCGPHIEETVMTAIQIHRTTHTDQPIHPSVRRVLAGCLAAAVAGSVVLLGCGALALAVHGPMQAGDPGAAEAVPITAASFAIGVVFSAFFGSILALALARRAKQPALTFLRAATVLTVVSLAAPLAASHTTEATRLILATGHLVAAAVVIPVIVRALHPRVA
jgi:hypothetical protein